MKNIWGALEGGCEVTIFSCEVTVELWGQTRKANNVWGHQYLCEVPDILIEIQMGKTRAYELIMIGNFIQILNNHITYVSEFLSFEKH